MRAQDRPRDRLEAAQDDQAVGHFGEALQEKRGARVLAPPTPPVHHVAFAQPGIRDRNPARVRRRVETEETVAAQRKDRRTLAAVRRAAGEEESLRACRAARHRPEVAQRLAVAGQARPEQGGELGAGAARKGV